MNDKTRNMISQFSSFATFSLGFIAPMFVAVSAVSPAPALIHCALMNSHDYTEAINFAYIDGDKAEVRRKIQREKTTK